jgi:hypothetical protein
LYQLGNGEHYHIACLYDHLIILLASSEVGTINQGKARSYPCLVC